MAQIPYFTLNNGTKIPSVGMGCWMGEPGGGTRVHEMCKNAVRLGYRHFDTAAGYANEEEVGRALRESGIPRSELYITTKLPNRGHHTVREAFEASLKALDCDYIDLYLVHWPQASIDGEELPETASPTIEETWTEMEKLLNTGKVRSIGISNFGPKLVERLLSHAKIVPVTNQVELHPCLPLVELKAVCEKNGILLTAYSPLGQPVPGEGNVLLKDPAVTRIAEAMQITPGQVLLSWGVQRETIVIPKSENIERMKANITLIKLSEEDMKAIDGIHRQLGLHKSLLGYHKEDGTVFGWTYDQLGWNMTKGGFVAL